MSQEVTSGARTEGQDIEGGNNGEFIQSQAGSSDNHIATQKSSVRK